MQSNTIIPASPGNCTVIRTQEGLEDHVLATLEREVPVEDLVSVLKAQLSAVRTEMRKAGIGDAREPVDFPDNQVRLNAVKVGLDLYLRLTEGKKPSGAGIRKRTITPQLLEAMEKTVAAARTEMERGEG